MGVDRGWESFLDRIGDTLVNLATIEVNTIEAAGMTGRKMPVWPQALLDVADRYFDYLAHGVDMCAFWRLAHPIALREQQAVRPGRRAAGANAVERTQQAIRQVICHRPGGSQVAIRPAGTADSETAPTEVGADLPVLDNGWLTFLLLREAAMAAKRYPFLRAGMTGEDDEKLVILARIMRNSDQLIGLVRSLEGTGLERFTGHLRNSATLFAEDIPPLPASAATRLRKIWDINTERIVLQTLFQLDGDVVTRIADRAERIESNPLWHAHQQNLELSIGHWGRMFGVVEKLLRWG